MGTGFSLEHKPVTVFVSVCRTPTEGKAPGEVVESFSFLPHATSADIKETLRKIANVDGSHEVMLRNTSGSSMVVGSAIPPNSRQNPYKLEVKPCMIGSSPLVERGGSGIEASIKKLINLVGDERKESGLLGDVAALRDQIEYIAGPSNQMSGFERITEEAESKTHRVLHPDDIHFPNAHFSDHVLAALKSPTLDVWAFDTDQLVALQFEMYVDLGLISEFQINIPTLQHFLLTVRANYQQQPFHNYRHCFCVSQMIFSLLHATTMVKQLTKLEQMIMLTAAICHDLDHPGLNNAYQVNACTELAVRYHDESPLENHHAAMAISILTDKNTNFISCLTKGDAKTFKTTIVKLILATDMSTHGKFMEQWKAVHRSLDIADGSQRELLMCMLLKCSDVSNETRPSTVAEFWVDSLLKEFFMQSDREKKEGLPFLPFMDRDKVTRSGAQIGFIKFVLMPLFEAMQVAFPVAFDPLVAQLNDALASFEVLKQEEEELKKEGKPLPELKDPPIPEEPMPRHSRHGRNKRVSQFPNVKERRNSITNGVAPDSESLKSLERDVEQTESVGTGAMMLSDSKLRCPSYPSSMGSTCGYIAKEMAAERADRQRRRSFCYGTSERQMRRSFCGTAPSLADNKSNPNNGSQPVVQAN